MGVVTNSKAEYIGTVYIGDKHSICLISGGDIIISEHAASRNRFKTPEISDRFWCIIRIVASGPIKVDRTPCEDILFWPCVSIRRNILSSRNNCHFIRFTVKSTVIDNQLQFVGSVFIWDKRWFCIAHIRKRRIIHTTSSRNL